MSRVEVALAVVDTTRAALDTLAQFKHLVKCSRALKQGVATLRAAYAVMGTPMPALPVEYLPERRPRKPRTPNKSRKKGATSETRLKIPEPLKVADESLELLADDPLVEAGNCRALLLEVVRRAVHDWVLYRQHEKPALKVLAHNAYVWLFEECPGHPDWEERHRALFLIEGEEYLVRGGRSLTSFLSICDVVGLDPDVVRERARQMTVQSIMFAGRPAERRRRRTRDEGVSIEEHGVMVDIDLNTLDEATSDDARVYAGYTSYIPEYMA